MTTVATTLDVPPPAAPADPSARDSRADRVFRLVVAGAAWFVLIVLAAAALSMLWGGREAFSTFGFGFFVSTDWDPVNRQFGALVPIYGTLVTAAIALIIAVPVSFGIALFLTEVAACGDCSCSCRSWPSMSTHGWTRT
jgi:phosphate transport system permease protein